MLFALQCSILVFVFRPVALVYFVEYDSVEISVKLTVTNSEFLMVESTLLYIIMVFLYALSAFLAEFFVKPLYCYSSGCHQILPDLQHLHSCLFHYMKIGFNVEDFVFRSVLFSKPRQIEKISHLEFITRHHQLCTDPCRTKCDSGPKMFRLCRSEVTEARLCPRHCCCRAAVLREALQP